MTATIWYGRSPFDAAFTEFFEERVRPVLAEAGAPPLAYLRSEHARNTFPALPVRTGEEVFVWFARLTDEDRVDDHLSRLELSQRWARPPQRLRLSPTERSLLR